MMKKLGARLLSAVMALSMLCGLLPSGALAADAEDETTLAEGTYKVTANLYVPAKENVALPGVQAYLTNPALPPTKPMKDNATLIVDKDGKTTLKFTELNQIFALTKITPSEKSKDDVSIIGHTEEEVTNIGDFSTTRYATLDMSVKQSVSKYYF